MIRPAMPNGLLALAACALALSLMACGRGRPAGQGGEAAPFAQGKRYLTEKVGDIAIAQIYADGFEDLTPEQRVVAYHLIQAAIHGDPIAYDQLHRDGLQVRHLLEEIVTHPARVKPEPLARITTYLKRFYVHHGNHHIRTTRKFLPEFSESELREAALAARAAGADLGPDDTSVEDRLVRLRRTIFDPSYDVSITVKDPPPGKDIVTASANNLYEGVTLKEVESFPERYPLNSKVIKRGGRIEELVYRAGDPSSGGPGGLYGHEMGDMADRLETVLPMVGPGQRAALEHLMRYFRTGEPEKFRQYNIAWVQDNPPVDAILGFIETYVDARSQKGFFEGQVSIVDQKTTHLMQWLAQNALYFEGRAPWKESYKRTRFKPPVANAITVLMETGGAGPVGWSGINLPNEQAIKEKYGSKSVLLANNIESRSAAVGAGLAEIFASSPEERDTGAKHYREARTLLVAMHEVLGHASGRVNPALKGDPSDHLREFYSTLEEARADLVALWNFFDEKLMADRMMSDPKVAEVAYQSYLWDNWVSLNQISEGDSFEEDHQRAEHLVCSYVAERTKAIRGFERDARHYRVVTDFKEMRRGVGELLAELMRIKAEGDYQAAKALISRYGVRFDPSLRDEVRRAAGAAGYPDVVAFVMPRYTPVYDSRRNIKDVTVSYPGDFLAEQLSYAGKSLPASR